MDFKQDVDRADGPGKCAGKTRYVRDLHIEGALEAVTIRSTVRRGIIREIILPEVPAGCFFAGASDIPGVNQVAYFRNPCPYFAEAEVAYIGQPILLAVGPDIGRARRLARQTRVVCEERPAIHTLEEALESSGEGGKPPLYGNDNVYVDETFAYGDVNRAFADAAQVFETTTRTCAQEHFYLEPQGVVAVPEGDRMIVYASTQGPHAMRLTVAAALGWPPERVRVRQTPLGGGFGGKIEPPFLIAGQAAVAANKCGRPVRLFYSRDEDMRATTKRHPSRVMVRSALDEKGNILAVDIDLVFQAGGYALSCAMVLDTGLKKATGVYHFPAARARGRAVATNNPMNGAFRGFGGPQAFFAIESHMNALARKLGRDPFDFKANYFIRQGDHTLTGGTYHFHVALPEVIASVKEQAEYATLSAAPPANPGRLRGVGQALFNFGAPFTVDTNAPLPKRYIGLLKREDGVVEILSELVDMGQGLHTAFRKIAAKTLDIPIERIVHHDADTDRVPEASITGASMSVVLFGRTLQNAAEKLKPRLCEPGEVRVLEPVEQPGHLSWDAAAQRGDPFHSYVWGAVIAEVEVDVTTCQVSVKNLWTTLDVGTAIDRRLIRGQIEGGSVQGLGYGLLEFMPPDAVTASLADYIVPTFLDVPPIESAIVENPYPPGPYGAKCVGEPPLVGIAPAIADAVSNACGVEIDRLPILPEDLMRKMREKP